MKRKLPKETYSTPPTFFLPEDLAHRLITRCLTLNTFYFMKLGLVCKVWHSIVFKDKRLDQLLRVAALFPSLAMVPKEAGNRYSALAFVRKAFLAASADLYVESHRETEWLIAVLLDKEGKQVATVMEHWTKKSTSRYQAKYNGSDPDNLSPTNDAEGVTDSIAGIRGDNRRACKEMMAPYGEFDKEMWKSSDYGTTWSFVTALIEHSGSSLLAFHSMKHFPRTVSSVNSPTTSDYLLGLFDIKISEGYSITNEVILGVFKKVFAEHVSFPAIIFTGGLSYPCLRLVHDYKEAMRFFIASLIGQIKTRVANPARWSYKEILHLMDTIKVIVHPPRRPPVYDKWELYKCIASNEHKVIPNPQRHLREHPCSKWSCFCLDCKRDLLVCCDCWVGRPDSWYSLQKLGEDVWKCEYCDLGGPKCRCERCYHNHERESIVHYTRSPLPGKEMRRFFARLTKEDQ